MAPNVPALPCCRHRHYRRGSLASQVFAPRGWLAGWRDYTASASTVVQLLMVPETICIVVSSICSVLILEKYMATLGAKLAWTLASLVLLLPVHGAVRSAYQWRESALRLLPDFRAALVNAFLASASCYWPGAGADGRRAPEEEEHLGREQRALLRLVDAVQEFLLTPRSGHWRQEVPCGHEGALQLDAAELQSREHILKLLGRLHVVSEALRTAGIPASEASRISHCNATLMREFERLWSFKTCRAPAALRSVARVTTQVLPLFYGPYCAHVVRGSNGVLDAPGAAAACLLSSIVPLLLIATINLGEQMENPYRHGSRDTARIKEEMELCRKALTTTVDNLNATRTERQEILEWEIVSSEGCGDDRCCPVSCISNAGGDNSV